MAILKYNNIGIKAIAACVPSHIEYNSDLGYFMSNEEIQKAITNIGIEERRIADDNVCASDLCYKAAAKLLEDNQIDPSSIDALIFVSQTSDYHQPATACVLQHKLGLSKECLAFDVNLACSGYVYGLSTNWLMKLNDKNSPINGINNFGYYKQFEEINLTIGFFSRISKSRILPFISPAANKLKFSIYSKVVNLVRLLYSTVFSVFVLSINFKYYELFPLKFNYIKIKIK